MPITDKNIGWARKRKRWAYDELHGLITIAVAEGGSSNHAEGAIMASPTDVTVALEELGALGLVGLRMNDADIMWGWVYCPIDLDPKWDIGVRVNFTQPDAVSTGVTFTVLYGIENAGDVISAPATALDTVLTEKNAGGAAIENLWTNRGLIKASTYSLTRAQIEGGAILTWKIVATTVDPADCSLLCLEIDYAPVKCVGSGNDSSRPTTTQPVSV